MLLQAAFLAVSAQTSLPNIVYILADDLGYGEVGCYGQTKIETPNIDRLASEGLKFTQHYSGAPVCAPARCVLMTGKDSAHAYVRGNKEMGGWGRYDPEGQLPIPASEVTVAEVLKTKGYATGAFGKWGLGGPGSTGHPCFQGFDKFFGYLCQKDAHNYYPTHLWNNHDVHVTDNRYFDAHQKIKDASEGFDQFIGVDYAPDLIMAEAEKWLQANKDKPFFLYLPFTEPHMAMQPPQKWVDHYPKSWDAKPYLGQQGYLPFPRPHAGYAAMISSLDEHVGQIVDMIDRLGLGKNTLIIFTSDNGPTHDVGGVDTEFFNSSGPLRGRKGSVYEGGIREPMIARWTGTIKAGTATDHISAFQDVMPTFADLVGAKTPKGIQGVSFLPTLLGHLKQQKNAPFYVWEFNEYGGQKAVRMGDWKAVQQNIHKGNKKIELYDLATDIGETTDVASQHPDLVAKALDIFTNDRTVSKDFPMAMYDKKD